jgi:CBS domain containing-hemolysin-like protein
MGMRKPKYIIFFIFNLLPLTCFASGATRHLEQIIADYLVWVVILIVPIAVVYIFWKIHILPEQYAEKIHHPQTKLIKVICLMSIVFGGLLWPLAWILAYSKPVLHKMAYGTDKSDEYYTDGETKHADKPLNLSIVEDEISNLKEKLDGLEAKRQKVLEQAKSKVMGS